MMKQQRRAACTVLAAAIACLAATVTQGADPATKKLAANLLDQHAPALVKVEAEISINIEVLEAPDAIKDAIQVPEQHETTTANGVVIDKSGLIAAPLMMLDPTLVMNDGITTETPLGPIRLGITGSFISVKIILEDGTEQEAEVALIDRTAGIALVKATGSSGNEMAAVTTGKEGVIPDPFDSLLSLTRLSEDFGRQATCSTGRFIQQFPEPNAMLDVTGALGTPGSAVFDSAGRFVGICIIPPPGEGSQPISAIIPSSRIVQLAQRVLGGKNNNQYDQIK